jgi:hypothetical protein
LVRGNTFTDRDNAPPPRGPVSPPPQRKRDEQNILSYHHNASIGQKPDTTQLNNTEDYDTAYELDDTIDYGDDEDETPRINTVSSKSEAISVTEAWEFALVYMAKKDYEGAYRIILECGDDMYLVRLMAITGSCVRKLSQQTANTLLARIVQILNTNFVQSLAIRFIQDGIENGVANSIEDHDKHMLLEALYDLSGSGARIGKQSAQVYNMLLQEIGDQ